MDMSKGLKNQPHPQQRIQPNLDHPFRNLTSTATSNTHKTPLPGIRPYDITTPNSMMNKNYNTNYNTSNNKYLTPSEVLMQQFDGAKNNSRARNTNESYAPKEISSAYKKGEGECIGFSTLPDQLHKRAVKRGFDFSFMVVGQTGLGKTTFLRSLFPKANLEKSEEGKASKTLQMERSYMEVEERGVRLRLTVIDSPGFGSSLDSSNDIKVVDSYLRDQLAGYLRAEMGTRRQAMQDNRIHCCLYFIDPSSRRLKALDLLAIKSLQDKVNLVPVIAKADSLTGAELKDVKNMIMKEMEKHGLRTYQLPDIGDDDDDDDYVARDKELKRAYPFSIVCGNKVVEVGGKRVVARVYPWGVVEVENKKHSDFKLLRYFLLNSHMHDLIETTKDVHYENYRSANLKEMQKNSIILESDEQIDALLQEKEMKILEMQKKLEEIKSQFSVSNIQDNDVGANVEGTKTKNRI